MTTFARLSPDGQSVQEICPHATPEGFYTLEVAAEFVVVPDGTLAGYLKDGDAWIAPAAPPEPTPPPFVPPSVTYDRFYNLFSIQQAIDIQNSTDPTVKEMYNRVQIGITARSEIDMSEPFVSGLLGYLATEAVTPEPTNDPHPRNYITSADMTRILHNVLPS